MEIKTMKKEFIDVPLEVKSDDVNDDGTFKGYGSTFGGTPDSGGDIVVKGAFKKTIRKGGRNGNGIAMLWQHNSDIPIGVWDALKEMDNGLEVDGSIVINTVMGHDAHALLKAGAVKGLSMGFNAVEYDIDRKKGIRYLKEVDLWEISIVTFPMNKRAGITSVKSIEDASTPRELENALRESGLSKSVAQYVVKLCTPSLRELGRLQKHDVLPMNRLLSELQAIKKQITIK